MSGRPIPAADLLETILAATRRIVEVRQEREPLTALARRAEGRATRTGRFRAAVGSPAGVSIIAECKRRSPSRGVLRVDYDAARIATAYAAAGAAAISVLTEPTFFDGSLDDLRAARAAVDLPLLRKDFVVSEYQLFEAAASGADAVLLIVAALDSASLRSLHGRAAELGLDVLVEVHDRGELAAALDAGAAIVGVNNRNLRTLEVDLSTSETLVAGIPADVTAVSESGIKNADDIRRLSQLGFKAFLIGERFMTQDDPGVELQTLLRRCAMTWDIKDAEGTKVKT